MLTGCVRCAWRGWSEREKESGRVDGPFLPSQVHRAAIRALAPKAVMRAGQICDIAADTEQKANFAGFFAPQKFQAAF